MSSYKVKVGGVWETPGGGSDINAGRTWPAPDDTTARPTHADGDDFNGATLDAAWTERNLGVGDLTFPPADPGISMYLGAAGDGIWRPAPTGDFEVVASVSGLNGTESGSMIGLGIVDASGNGVGTSMYNGGFGFHLWTLTAYLWSGSGANVPMSVEERGRSADMMYMALRKTGTSYTSRFSLDGTTWSSYTAALVNATAMTQIGFGRFLANGGNLKCTLHRFNVYPGPGFYS